eukprot:s1093_g10.t1
MASMDHVEVFTPSHLDRLEFPTAAWTLSYTRACETYFRTLDGSPQIAFLSLPALLQHGQPALRDIGQHPQSTSAAHALLTCVDCKLRGDQVSRRPCSKLAEQRQGAAPVADSDRCFQSCQLGYQRRLQLYLELMQLVEQRHRLVPPACLLTCTYSGGAAAQTEAGL